MHWHFTHRHFFLHLLHLYHLYFSCKLTVFRISDCWKHYSTKHLKWSRQVVTMSMRNYIPLWHWWQISPVDHVQISTGLHAVHPDHGGMLTRLTRMAGCPVTTYYQHHTSIWNDLYCVEWDDNSTIPYHTSIWHVHYFHISTTD